MKKSLMFRFTLIYFLGITIFWFLNEIINLSMELESIMILSFISSFYYVLFSIDSRINDNEELIKTNYWQLKNQFKRKGNAKEKKDSNKQVL